MINNNKILVLFGLNETVKKGLNYKKTKTDNLIFFFSLQGLIKSRTTHKTSRKRSDNIPEFKIKVCFYALVKVIPYFICIDDIPQVWHTARANIFVPEN